MDVPSVVYTMASAAQMCISNISIYCGCITHIKENLNWFYAAQINTNNGNIVNVVNRTPYNGHVLVIFIKLVEATKVSKIQLRSV